MLRRVLIAVAAAACLHACSSAVSRTVEHSAGDVRVMIQANEQPLSMTHYFPSASHQSEHTPDSLVWRFTLNERDYARMVITLDPKGADRTGVTYRFEELEDAVGPGIPFLQKTARMTSEEILAATLDGRAVDQAMLQERLKLEAAKDPQAMARGYMEASGELYKQVQETGGAFSENSRPARRSKLDDKPLP